MFIYFTSLEYLEKQTKLEEEEVRTEKAGKQFHLRTTGATKKKIQIHYVSEFVVTWFTA